MTSKKLKRLAVDANPILSALIRGKAFEIFSSPDLELCTTEHTVREVLAHIPELAEKIRRKGAGIPVEDLYFALVVAPLKIYSPDFYADSMAIARKRIEKRDPEDVDLLALALKFSIPIWINDQDYSVSKVKTYTTGQLLKKLFSK